MAVNRQWGRPWAFRSGRKRLVCWGSCERVTDEVGVISGCGSCASTVRTWMGPSRTTVRRSCSRTSTETGRTFRLRHPLPVAWAHPRSWQPPNAHYRSRRSTPRRHSRRPYFANISCAVSTARRLKHDERDHARGWLGHHMAGRPSLCPSQRFASRPSCAPPKRHEGSARNAMLRLCP